MKYRTSLEGIILSSKFLNKDADLNILILSKVHGKVYCTAKGSVKIKSRKRGSLEPFSTVRVSLSRSKYPVVQEIEVLKSRSFLRKDLKKMSVAYYFSEVAGKLSTIEESGQAGFSLLEKYLDDLENTKSLKTFRMRYTEEMLKASGFWPHQKLLDDPDKLFESITDKKLSSIRVGKKLVKRYN